MLVLTRKVGERIVTSNGITITVVALRGEKVRLGIDAPDDVKIHRQEVWDQIVPNAPDKSDKPAEQPITVVARRGEKVRLGIDAPDDVKIHRQEVWDGGH